MTSDRLHNAGARYRGMPMSPNDRQLFQQILDALSTTGVSLPVIWVQLCAVVSLLTQGVADILWPNGKRSPIGLSGVVIGPSGCGKSLVFDLLMAVVEAFTAKRGEHPLIGDATAAGIFQHLQRFRCAGLFSKDAGRLQTRLKDEASTLADLIDGTTVRRWRGNSEPLMVSQPRFCMLHLLHHEEAESSHLWNPRLSGVGIANRSLMGNGEPLNGAVHDLHLPESLRTAFQGQAEELLSATVENARKAGEQLPAISMSAGASELFKREDANARLDAHRPGPWVGRDAYVSRHAERTLRLAGAIHLLNHGVSTGLKRDVMPDTVALASATCWRSTKEFERFTYRPAQEDVDAQVLLDKFQLFFQRTGQGFVTRNELRRGIENVSLTPARMRAALRSLARAGLIRIQPEGKEDFIVFIFTTSSSGRWL